MKAEINAYPLTSLFFFRALLQFSRISVDLVVSVTVHCGVSGAEQAFSIDSL